MDHQKTIEEVENEIVEEFSMIEDRSVKNEYIMDIGKKLPPLDEQYKKDENRVRGCQSTVWLVADYKDGRVFFDADSDAFTTKGLISMLIRVLSGQTPDNILNARLDFIEKIGLKNLLSQARNNGLGSMIKQMKNFALAYKLKNAG